MSENQELTFKKYLVAYVDVLGFKNLISQIKGKKEKQKSFLEKYLVKAKNQASIIEGTKEKSNIDLKIQIMSDTFFFSIPTEENELVNHMAHLCVAVGNLQAYLASIDIWTRGAITYGELLRFEGNVVGPALIESYIMEEQAADYPRVIIDPQIYNKFQSREDFLNQVNAIQFSNWKGRKIFFQNKSSIFEDYKENFDDLMFVDYFNAFFNVWIDTQESHQNQLPEAIKNIKKNMYSSPSIYRKFVWVQKYFALKRSHLTSTDMTWNESEYGFQDIDTAFLKPLDSLFNF